MLSPLESVLRPVAKLLNRNISSTTPARELCEQLQGKSVAVRVRDTALATYFMFDDNVVSLATDFHSDPDVVITGSLLTLAKLTGGGGIGAVRDGELELTGDAATANLFQKLLHFAKPDLEEELSSVIGDVAAHRLGQITKDVGAWARDARSTMGSNIREYLQEESRDVPSRYEVERFTDEVNTIRDDVERIAARLRRLENEQ